MLIMISSYGSTVSHEPWRVQLHPRMTCRPLSHPPGASWPPRARRLCPGRSRAECERRAFPELVEDDGREDATSAAWTTQGDDNVIYICTNGPVATGYIVDLGVGHGRMQGEEVFI